MFCNDPSSFKSLVFRLLFSLYSLINSSCLLFKFIKVSFIISSIEVCLVLSKFTLNHTSLAIVVEPSSKVTVELCFIVFPFSSVFVFL